MQVGVLGGRIGAYSAPSRGSVFWFTIPLIVPDRSSSPPPTEFAFSSPPEPADHLELVGPTAGPSQSSNCSSPVVSAMNLAHSLDPVAEAGTSSSGWAYHTSQSDIEVAATCVVPCVAALLEKGGMPECREGHAPALDVYGTSASCGKQPSADVHPTPTQYDEAPDQLSSAHTGAGSGSSSPSTAAITTTFGHTSPIQSQAQGLACIHVRASQAAAAAVSSTQQLTAICSPTLSQAQVTGRPSFTGSGQLGARYRSSVDHSLPRFSMDLPPHFTMNTNQPQLTRDGGASEVSGSDADDASSGAGQPSMAGISNSNSSSNLTTYTSTTVAERTQQHLAALKGRKVLLVEDNLINQTVARKMLHSLGLQCEVASNGLEAVKTIEASVAAVTEQHGKHEHDGDMLHANGSSPGASSDSPPKLQSAVTGMVGVHM